MLGGPHSRAYHGGLATRGDSRVNGWIEDGSLPAWTIDAMKHRPERMQVVETADSDFNMGLTTYHSPSFALGVSVNEGLGDQGNSLISQFLRPGTNASGVLYSRYLIDDKWMGTYLSSDRPHRNARSDAGGKILRGAARPRAIGIYTPSELQYAKSAKATLIWTDRKSIDEILINGHRIDQLPAKISPSDTDRSLQRRCDDCCPTADMHRPGIPLTDATRSDWRRPGPRDV